VVAFEIMAKVAKTMSGFGEETKTLAIFFLILFTS
jgi:hypothetical protein